MAANVQAGKENNQSVISVRPEARPTVTVEKEAKVENIDQSTTTNNNVDPLLIALLIIGWLAPSPAEIGRSFLKLFRRKP